MIAKTFEIRDRNTFTVALAVQLQPSNETDRYLLARAGFGATPEDQGRYIQLIQIKGGSGRSSCDPYDWNDRTWKAAHAFIEKHFDELESGAVVDARFILGETPAPCISERAEGF